MDESDEFVGEELEDRIPKLTLKICSMAQRMLVVRRPGFQQNRKDVQQQ
jgi:hypothetical protein